MSVTAFVAAAVSVGPLPVGPAELGPELELDDVPVPGVTVVVGVDLLEEQPAARIAVTASAAQPRAKVGW
jgi:hypothetical protein